MKDKILYEQSQDLINDAVEILRKHNLWRRGGDDPMTHPREIGVAIDTVVNYFKKFSIYPDQPPTVASDHTTPEAAVNDTDKPDFEGEAIRSAIDNVHANGNTYDYRMGFEFGSNKVWTDHVIPRDKTIAELKAYISERLDAENRFDKAEKQWLAKYDELQAKIKELEEENRKLSQFDER